jgi:YidC/Oxa1 family membrane protein insertase
VFLYNLPIFKQLVELLHYVLVHLNAVFASWGLGPNWSWGLAIVGLTVIVRLILFPVTWKQFSSAQAMAAVQPKIKELQRKYKNDRAKLQQETMKLYQEHHVNPFASCLPLLLQLPVFIALYAAISGRATYLNAVSVDALKRAGFLWIQPGVGPPSHIIHGLGNPDPTYILLVLYIVTQLISTELMLTPQTDKQQKYIMRAMPIIFVFILFRFPSGLFVYWVTTNLWTIGQQLIIRRVMKPRDLATMAAKPPRRNRIMESILAAQGERTKEDDILAKRRQKAAELAAGAKQGGTQQAKRSSAQPAKQSGAQPAKKGGPRKPPPGKGKHKSGPPADQGKGKSGPTGG